MSAPGADWLRRVFGPLRAREAAAAYAQLFDRNSRAGRLVLADLAAYCRAGRTSFAPGDPCQTAFNEGARDAFLHVLELSGLSPDEFPAIMKEIERD